MRRAIFMNLLSSDQGVGIRVRAVASASYGLPVYVMLLLVEGVAAALLVGGGGWVVIVDVVVVVCIAVEVEEVDEEEAGCLNLLDVQ